jgi:hypothetical protein
MDMSELSRQFGVIPTPLDEFIRRKLIVGQA